MSGRILLFSDGAAGAAGLTGCLGPKLGPESQLLGAGLAADQPRPFAEDVCQALAALAAEHQPDLIVIAATPLGREAAPRLAVRLQTGCVSDCVAIDRDAAGRIVAERPVYGGAALAAVAFAAAPAICLVSPDGAGGAAGGAVESAALSIAAGATAKEVVARRPVDQGIDITAAERIVAAGRGIARREDLALVQSLADALQAEVACSRPLSEDFGWLPLQRQVGLTGQTVRPALYLALGISGQVQHVVGMKDAKVIVAVNSNRSAPIFQVADYGLVGDLYKVIPELIAACQGSES